MKKFRQLDIERESTMVLTSLISENATLQK